MNTKRLLYVMLLIAAFCLPSSVYASFADSVSVENKIFTGDIQIGIKEYEIRNGKEVAYSNPKVILPGDQISKIPRITNYASPCWIRAKIIFQNASKNLNGLDESMILHIGKSWKKSGEYYYYTKVLDNGKSTDLFTGVSIPAAWTDAHSDQKMQIQIRVDAIQSANFQCVHETNGKITCKKEKIPLYVQFNGAAHKLIAVPDDFFSNFSKAMPGDLLMDDVEISNTTENEAEIFFQTKVENQSAMQETLLEKLNLTITMRGVVIYEGNLRASSLNEGISLGKFLPGQKERLSFSIVIPKELDNLYALQDASVRWIFTVKENETDAGINASENNFFSETAPGEDGKEKTSSVKTGDNSPIGILIFYILLGAAVFPVSLGIRKGEKNEK